MYCEKCFSKLDPSAETQCCPRCGRGFDPADPKTYLPRPFPDKWMIITYVAATTIISLAAAFLVALSK